MLGHFSKVPNMEFYDSSSDEGCAVPSRQKRRNETKRPHFEVAVRSHHKNKGEGGEGEWNNRSGGKGRGRGENKKNNAKQNENKVEERGRY